MTIKHLFPVAKPTFALNFATDRALDSRITFTRASIGTYVDANGVIQTAASDEPRFDHDPVTGESLGLLIEESRTNEFPYSEEFDQWTLADVVVATNATTAPNGAPTADKLSSTTGAWPSYCRQDFTGSGTRVLSVFAKAAESSWIAAGGIGSGGEVAWFNLATGVPGAKQANVISSSMEAFPDGWYRCSVVCDFQSYGGVIPASGDNSLNISPIGDGFYLWGAHLEAGSFPTSYISTAGSAVTRAVDIATIGGTNFSPWYNQSEGTIYAELANMTTTGANAVWSFDDNTSSQRIMYRVNRGFVMTGYTTISDNENPVTAKFAYGIKANDYGGAKDGSILTAGTPGSVLPTVDRLNLGTGPGLAHSSGHIVRLSYYPRRLSNEQLQALTA